MNEIRIIELTSDESIIGGEPWGKHDRAASVAKFLEMVEAAVKAAYPDFEIAITGENNRYADEIDVYIDHTDEDRVEAAEREDEIKRDVEDMISSIHQDWKWLVERAL